MLVVHCDGSIADKNPGGRGFTGWFIQNDRGERIVDRSNALGAHALMTNNVAEYAAVLAAISYLCVNNLITEAVQFRSDSQLIVRQLQGVYKCTLPHLRTLRDQIWALAQRFPAVDYVWIPREQNTIADTLSKSLWKCESKV